MARPARSEKRAGWDDHTRITALEDDADEAEYRQSNIESKLDGIRNWLVGGAISFATSALLLAVNIAVLVTKGR